MNLRRQLFVYGLISILISLWGTAHAQTIYGPGGLFIHPSAFTASAGQWGLNVSYFTQTVGKGTETEWLPVSVTYAPTNKIEVGGLFVDRRFGIHRESGGAFAKVQIVSDTVSHPAFALTGSYLDGDVKQSSVSGVFSHEFMSNGRSIFELHTGLEWARRSDIARPGDSLSAFLGAALPLGHHFRLVGETGTLFSFDRHESSAIGVTWQATRAIQIGVGFVNTGRSKDNEFFVGVGYALGGANQRKGTTP